MSKKVLMWVFGFLAAASIGTCLGLALPQEAPQNVIGVSRQQAATLDEFGQPMVYQRGYVEPKNAKWDHQAASSRHNGRIDRLPRVDASSWDCRELGLVPPIVDQGNCGSCWDFAGVCIVTCSMIKSGYGTNDGKFMLSEQFVLDCVPSGGCDGDDHSTVLHAAKSSGLPSRTDYGQYVARRQNCRNIGSMKLYRIQDWGYCKKGQSSGIAEIQDIKNAVVAFGPISTAVAADGSWDRYHGGVYVPSNSRNINHEVVIVGWKDDAGIASGGYWLMRNSWGVAWGEGGYMKIPYRANGIGTEAVWCVATPLSPPPSPPSPPPPTPADLPLINLPNGLPPGQYHIVPVPPQPGGKADAETQYSGKP